MKQQKKSNPWLLATRYLLPAPEAGQALLIVIMVLATALTVVLATTFTARTDTQISRLEAESQKSLAAAEAGIEHALQQGLAVGQDPVSISAIPGFSSFGGATNATADDTSQPFTTPLLRKDEQYTYYLSAYNKTNNTFSPTAGRTIYFCWGTAGSSTRPVIEVAAIADDYTFRRPIPFDPKYGAGSCDGNCTIQNAMRPGTATTAICGAGTNFAYAEWLSFGSNRLVALIRVLQDSTKVKVVEQSFTRVPQGTVINSSAKSSSGTEKKVRLFQSYPQFPSDFLVSQL